MSYQNDRIANVVDRVNRAYFLPAMQRSYEWKPDQILALFDSLLKGYPISTFLFWRPDEAALQGQKVYKFIENLRDDLIDNEVANLAGHTGVELCLDGQQRLTSLIIGLKGSIEIRPKGTRKNSRQLNPRNHLFINLLKNPNSADADEDQNDEDGLKISYGLKFFPEGERPTKEGPSQLWMQIGEILRCKTNEIKDEMFKAIQEKNQRITEADSWTIARRNFDQLHHAIWKESAISYYVVQDDSFERVLDIFVRANSGGTKLSKSDLLLSTMVTHWQRGDAREEIKTFVRNLNIVMGPNTKLFRKDLVMKGCLLLSNLDPRYDVANFTKSNIEKIFGLWPRIKIAIQDAVQLVKTFGLNAQTLTSTNAVLPIAFFLMHCTTSNLQGSSHTDTRNRSMIQVWLLNALLNSTFSGTSDATLVLARKAIHRAQEIEPDFPLRVLLADLTVRGRQTSLSPNAVKDLFEEINYQDNRTFLLLSLAYDARDWTSHSIDHIVPQASLDRNQLRRQNFQEDQIDNILGSVHRIGNLQLLPAKDNSEKRNKNPAEWLRERGSEFLKENLIPDNYGELLSDIRYFPTFVAQREKMLVDRLLQSSLGG